MCIVCLLWLYIKRLLNPCVYVKDHSDDLYMHLWFNMQLRGPYQDHSP